MKPWFLQAGLFWIVVASLLSGCNDGINQENRKSLKQVGLAIVGFKENVGYFPPSQIKDPAGNSMHSWRVLVLPYLESNGVYNRYDFQIPWNLGSNKELISTSESNGKMNVRSVYCGKDGVVSHIVLLLPSLPAPSDVPSKIRSSTVGCSALESTLNNKVVVLWTNPATVVWAEPRDISISDLEADPNLINSIQFAIQVSSNGEIEFLDRQAISKLIGAL